MEFDEYRVRLGSHLQAVRKAHGLTQEQVARCLKMDRVSIGYIEQGKRSPKISTLYELAQCYGVEMRELFEFDDSQLKSFDDTSARDVSSRDVSSGMSR